MTSFIASDFGKWIRDELQLVKGILIHYVSNKVGEEKGRAWELGGKIDSLI